MLKQCGQVATIFSGAGALIELSVSTFCMPSIWNRNSLPSRRAGSPVHVSPAPSTANSTPAACSSSANARVTFFERSSSAPAQPTQNRYSMSASSLVPGSARRTSKARLCIHSSRPLSARPHGLPLFSRLRSITPASDGNADSISTW